MNTYTLPGGDVFILSIIVLFIGSKLSNRFVFLDKNNIPDAVTGGLCCSLLVGLIYFIFDVQISMDMELRDYLLLVFFSTIGLTAKINLLKSGGKLLGLMVIVAVVFLFIQDITGVGLVSLIGGNPAYGLFGGSISFAGGYGTAIAWGNTAAEAGLELAKEVGMACATFGLIAGGMIGGPISARLITKHQLQPKEDTAKPVSEVQTTTTVQATLNEVLKTLFWVCTCVELGDLVNRILFNKGVVLPGFLTAMFVGIVITNMADYLKKPLDQDLIQRVNDLSLPLFISMSMMSIQIWQLFGAMGPILLILFAQVLVMTWFSVFIVFRVMGKNYDAAVMSAGFAGLGLGATPVGIANMNAITSKFGPSPKAFLVIPLVGAFFLDIANALVIKFFLGFLA